MSLRVVSIYPERESDFKVGEAALFGELKAEAAKALKLGLEDYTWSLVTFGQDVVSLDGKGADFKLAIGEGSTLIAIPPASVLPPRKRRVKEEKPEADVDEKFRGLTKENIFKKLAKAQGKQRTVCLEYLDIFTSEILKQKKVESLPRELFTFVVKRDSISIPELELFDIVVAWGRARLKEKSTPETPAALKAELGDILLAVRFPIMTTEQIATKVTATGLLEQAQILELFTYLAQKDMGMKPGKSLAVFNSNPRKGAGLYGAPGTHIPKDSWQLATIGGEWSYGSWDNVNSGDRVRVADIDAIHKIITGTTTAEYLSGEHYNFPRGGSVRCGIYTYPTSDPHFLEIKFTKGILMARSFRFYCTRLEGGVRLRMMYKKPGGASFDTDLLPPGWAAPTLTNGGGQRQWVEVNFGKPIQMEGMRIEIRGGQCAFHVLDWVTGP